MGMWPFRRKSNKTLSRGGAENLRLMEETMRDAGAQGMDGDIMATSPERRKSRRDKKRRSSRDSKKLHRDPEKLRTYSFSPGRSDKVRIPQDVIVPPIPRIPSKHKGRAGERDTEVLDHSAFGQKPTRVTTQPPESTTKDWERAPTLHKRSAQDLARRKSSKKRKEEHDREAEIKAMVAFMPSRPATESGTAGRPMKRESKRMHVGLNRNLQNPSSDISLPLAESIHASLTSNLENPTSYKLSALDVLAPRPTIRYSENPRYATPEGSKSKKRRAAERVSIPVEILDASNRIDDLADNLDASELRELMERDQKRRDKKRIIERITTEKKLARRQEKQKEGEEKAAQEGTPPPPNMERGVLGRDVVGLGIGTSAVVTSSTRTGSTDSETEREKHPNEASRNNSTASVPNPIQRSVSEVSEQLTPSSEVSDPVIETARVGTVGKANISPRASPRGHVRGASSISQMMDLASEDKATSLVPAARVQESIRQTPTESASRATPQSWTSFFKRSKVKRTSTPSFSNTSRDSMQHGQGPQTGYTPMRSTSNLPKRTMSKFREDLPELPISPPDSRVQSPEADNVPPIRTDHLDKKTGSRASIDDPRMRYGTPTSGHRSLDTLRRGTSASGHRSIDSPSPEPIALMSQSLASIDSEGSWLSGRRGGSKRGSAQAALYPLRDSASSIHRQRYNQYSESNEELVLTPEDEYLTRLPPGPDEEDPMSVQPAAHALSDDDNGESRGASPVPTEQPTWGAVARQPTVIHRQPRAKSTEGLLNDFDLDSGSEPPGETPQEMGNRKSYGFNKNLLEDDEVSIHRASSIDLVKSHARHISAGSAKLLELKKSADGRRTSVG